MARMAPSLALVALAVFALPGTARAVDSGAMCRAPQAPGGKPAVCMDLFYEVLASYGTWIETDRYGTLFCPAPEKFDADFRPFAKGHWVMSEAGWTFVGEHPVSWVTDHYGRWVEAGLHGCTWGWVPGEIWSPAWVDFHVGENVIAWRPAPFDGVPVQLRVPPATRLQYVQMGSGPQPPSPHSFVAVPDGDFQTQPIQEAALSGPALHAALRDTVILPDPRAGLHSRERVAVVEQMLEARGLREPAGGRGAGSGDLLGEPPEPGVRVTRKGQGRPVGPGRAAVSGTVRTGRRGSEGAGATQPKPGQTPPGTGKVYWGGDQNQGGFTQPGPQGGVKVLDWGKPKPKQLPATPPGTPTIPTAPPSPTSGGTQAPPANSPAR